MVRMINLLNITNRIFSFQIMKIHLQDITILVLATEKIEILMNQLQILKKHLNGLNNEM